MTSKSPLFQKRHYEYLVERLVLDTKLSSTTKFEALNWLVAVLKTDNANFDPERFYLRYYKLTERYSLSLEQQNDHDPS